MTGTLGRVLIRSQCVVYRTLGHVEIGHQTNAKTVPAECIGYFDFKVLFRQHTEVWEEAAKVRTDPAPALRGAPAGCAHADPRTLTHLRPRSSSRT